MKLGYKVFIGANVAGVVLHLLSIRLPDILENIFGFVVLGFLLHAIFIEKTPVKVPVPTWNICPQCGKKFFGTRAYCSQCSFRADEEYHYYHRKR